MFVKVLLYYHNMYFNVSFLCPILPLIGWPNLLQSSVARLEAVEVGVGVEGLPALLLHPPHHLLQLLVPPLLHLGHAGRAPAVRRHHHVGEGGEVVVGGGAAGGGLATHLQGAPGAGPRVTLP